MHKAFKWDLEQKKFEKCIRLLCHPLNMQKSVFLALWDNYEELKLALVGFLAIKSENAVRIAKLFLLKKRARAASGNDKLKRGNILPLSEELRILQVIRTSPDLSKINCALLIFFLSGKIHIIIFFICINKHIH